MENLLLNLSSWGDWLYLVIFVGMLIEGNVTMFIVGFLLSSNTALSGVGLVFSAFLGSVTEQYFWFWLGKKLNNLNSRFVIWAVKASNHFDKHFIHRPKLTLFISKFIYGIHRAAIARAGVIGISGKTYAKLILPVLILWMAIIGGLGYGIKSSFNLVDQYLQYTELILLGLLISVVLLQRYVLSGKLKTLWKKI